jgi:hypothetical protein
MRLAWTAKYWRERGQSRGARRAYQRIVVQVRVRLTHRRLDASDHQSAKLVMPGAWTRAMMSWGPATSSARCTPSMRLIAWATWPALPTSVWMSTYALSSPALTLANRADHRPDQHQL